MNAQVEPQLRQLRNAADLSSESLAEYVGADVATLDRWERGELPIPEAHVALLSDHFGVSATYLLNGAPMIPPVAAIRSVAAYHGESSERDVLERAVTDMDGWISELPSRSGWRLAFIQSRRELLSALNSSAPVA
jgi:transcriptional regulator with XRE-family HTH domain